MGTAYVCYYARCRETGEIWEAHDFKTLYDMARRSLKGEMHHSTYYNNILVTLCYGVAFEDGHSMQHFCVRKICNVFCSGCDGRVYFDVFRY